MADEYGLGRIHIPDERDRNYPAQAVLPTAPSRTNRYWDAGWRGNQGAKPWCVAFAWFHSLEMMGRQGTPDKWDPDWVYHQAQLVDQWPGTGYDGTSVRAGADVLRREGALTEYRWANTVDEVATAVIEHGPVVVGTKWTRDMFRPQVRDGRPFLEPTGPVEGGHAWVISGVNLNSEVFKMTNSWGRNWGVKGSAWLTFDVLGELLEDDGEAAIAVTP